MKIVNFFNSLSFKIGSIIILVEIVILTVLGLVYINSFSIQVDSRLVSKVQLPGILMDAGLLSYDSVSDPEIMQKLVGNQLISGLVVGVNGNVFYSLNPEHIEKPVSEISSVDVTLFNSDTLQDTIIHYPEKLISVSPIYGSDRETPRFFAYTEIRTSESVAEKNTLTRLFLFGSIITILITSLVIFLSFNNLILRPFKKLGNVLSIVENGDLSIRVKEKKHMDEMGYLHRRTNTMIESLEKNQEQIRHLNRILRAIRNINQLITQERDIDNLLEKACTVLTDTHDYAAVWILLVDENNSPWKFYRIGSKGEKMTIQDLHVEGNLMPCAQSTLKNRKREFIIQNSEFCKTCLIFNKCGNLYNLMAIPLEVEEKVYGILNIAFYNEFTVNEDEISLLEEVAGDLSFALFSFELEEKRNNAEKQLRKLNEELEDRVHQRTAQLEFAYKEMEAFSYSVSHDLRSPLSGIDGWSLALQEDYSSKLDEEAMNYLGRVRSEAQRMAEIIDALLNLSRLSRTKMDFIEVDLSSMAETISIELKSAEKHRNVSFIIQPNLIVRGDPHLLEIVLSNLLGNAYKFTAKIDKAKIELGVSSRKGIETYYVRDNGIGFEMKFADRLFGVFKRLHKESEFPGTGVGLSTVQRIIHRHGGSIWAEASPDEGATFYFTLGVNL